MITCKSKTVAKSFLICGVGGQGILLLSDIIAKMALVTGLDVKKSEIHGMAQRGGAVTSAVRYGEKVYSPLIGIGEADFLLAFEKLEALRNVHFLKPKGECIVNDYELPPYFVTAGKEKYPENIIEELEGRNATVIVVPAFRMAKKLGNAKAVNTILLGVLARRLDFSEKQWLALLKQNIKSDFLDINIKAFKSGYSFS